MGFSILFLFLVSHLYAQTPAYYKSFFPGKVWYDTAGNPINAHGGGILFYGGKYYWFGQIMVPGNGGSDAWVGVSCYSSSDLYNWSYEGVALSVEDDASHPIESPCKYFL